MIDIIQNFILSIFGDNPILATIIISMVPVVELRGAIPFGSSKEIWGDNALSVLEASFYTVIGSIISALAVILLMIPIFKLLKKAKIFRGFIESLEIKFKKKSDKIQMDAEENKKKSLKKWLGVMAFVAIPLPLTGVWTGSAVAVFLEMGFWKSFTSISIGAIIAACIVMIVSSILGEGALVIFYAFLIILIVLVVAYIVKALFIKIKVEKLN